MTTLVRNDLRNVAIIAHVDHGKTTLVDELLKQSGTFRTNEQVEERAMDSNDIERERGITILAKNTAIDYKNTRINIVDTPGHADFGGEVERIMRMVDGVILVVDAREGCMPQTRFVLKKALEQGLQPIVVVNKIDKPMVRPLEVVDEVVDLLIDLGADEDQLEFPVVYASAVNGSSSFEPELDKQEDTITNVLDLILEHTPAPVDNTMEPLQFQVTMLDYDNYLGRIGVGRVFRGEIKVGDSVSLSKLDGSTKNFRVTKLFGYFGLKRVEIETAKAGDLIAIAGMEDINVGETVCPTSHVDPLPLLRIDEPTLQMTFIVNNSPFAGREGDLVTSRKIEERLEKELETDVSLRIENTDSPDRWIVSGRGELHLGILIENMRREGYEIQVSKPQVIIKEEEGVKVEPFERVVIDTPEEYTGSVMESIGLRKGELTNMQTMDNGQTKMEFIVPSRGLIGYRNEFLSATRGYGIMNHTFEEYRPFIQADIGGRRSGVMVSIETGKATAYAISALEDRGTIFIEPGIEVYEGMIIGECNRDVDLAVNVVKAKQLTNMRASAKDSTNVLKRPRVFSLEESLTFLNEDEYCEITPQSVRLRKQVLNKNEREKQEKRRRLGKD
ncbi:MULTISPECIES: translational GTPase TypA [Exiguobacterium]|jgi:GTP-binding protein|uniref:translational GTPase TypA n=2 Tax=Bacillales Family XII. Incertae Sedis TaxID=539742 RepID=UPI00044B6C73|nr:MULTISPECIES: translational GTPase TypA [Exiguobacterium]EZP60702.1 GTP-binding protein TypA/BipA [Exiguobacterium sp. RIT341]KQS40234.1 GTP-binding protein TypA [Exiguobacterium sp. Leaf196]MDQ6467267.1 translational GTPase TypA [Exiguobacterium acetylicum]MDT0171895.1 translational GTPase TypA [Exiguobacterium sp. BRG2]HAZ38275.1 translational GTPase TypA [Exiguobacterium sp.]